MEEIKFREPVALLKGSKGMELPAWKQVSGGPRRLLLLEQGANQGEGSVEDGEQGKRCKALKGSDVSVQGGGWLVPCSATARQAKKLRSYFNAATRSYLRDGCTQQLPGNHNEGQQNPRP